MHDVCIRHRLPHLSLMAAVPVLLRPARLQCLRLHGWQSRDNTWLGKTTPPVVPELPAASKAEGNDGAIRHRHHRVPLANANFPRDRSFTSRQAFCHARWGITVDALTLVDHAA